MMSVALGLAAVALGSYGVYYWSGDFAGLIKGLVPLSFACGGLVAIAAGISSLRK